MTQQLSRARDQYILDGCLGRRWSRPQMNISDMRRISLSNVQVPGVDEPDFVKHDAGYLYVATHDGVKVFDAWPPAQARELTTIEVSGHPHHLFASGDRLVVYSSSRPRREPDCSYAYTGCDAVGDGQATLLSVFDVTDPAHPKQLQALELSGAYVAARRVEHQVHTVVYDVAHRFRGLRYHLDQQPESSDSALRLFDQLRQENLRKIEQVDVLDLVPHVRDRATGQQLFTDCSYHAPLSDEAGMLSVVSLDIASSDAPQRSMLQSRAGIVYASPNAIYLAVSRARGTALHQFQLSGSTNHYAASGLVPGRVLNQLAMDEHAGHLRIATTAGSAASLNAANHLSVLRREGEHLETVGQLSNLARTEDIRSVRFDGDRAFVVTFKKTDPLFAFDLSKPSDPRQLAELKVPGFSTYMHLIDSNHLLTIGYDADDQGVLGVLLQIFDITDPRKPRRSHHEIIGTRGSSSAALTNLLAFTYFPNNHTLSLPITLCQSDGAGDHSQPSFSGLLLYGVHVNTGFRRRGAIAHTDESATCANWWTRGDSVVERSFLSQNFVYSISKREIKIRYLHNLSQELVTLPLDD